MNIEISILVIVALLYIISRLRKLMSSDTTDIEARNGVIKDLLQNKTISTSDAANALVNILGSLDLESHTIEKVKEEHELDKLTNNAIDDHNKGQGKKEAIGKTVSVIITILKFLV